MIISCDMIYDMITVRFSYLESNSTSELLKDHLKTIFPKLRDVSFEYLRAQGGGPGKSMFRITDDQPTPSISRIAASRAGIVYVRPLSAILDGNNDNSLK
jgi:hypothetical protein